MAEVEPGERHHDSGARGGGNEDKGGARASRRMRADVLPRKGDAWRS